MKRWCAIAGFVWLAGVHAHAEAPPAIHGSGDAYAGPGIALAWGILRGTSEATTIVVVRIVADAQAYPWLSVAGVDPFTKAEQPLQPATRVAGAIDVRVPRARFAEVPRTEIRLFDSTSAMEAGKASFTVFYLGVPDTTPEFADASKLDGYLDARIVRARAGAPNGPR